MISKENEVARFFEKLGLKMNIYKPTATSPQFSIMMHTLVVQPDSDIDPERGRKLLHYYFNGVKGTEGRPKVILHDFNPNGHGITGICKRCGCTEMDACEDRDTGTCYWVKEDLCSACAAPEEKAVAMGEIIKLRGGNKL